MFFTRGLGLPVAQVGAGLTAAGLLGLLGGVTLGHLADQHGPRPVYVGLLCGQGLAVGAFALAGSFWAFVASATVVAVLNQGVQAALGAMIARLTEGQPGGAVRLRAYLRAVTNVGISVGAAAAGLAIAADTAAAYRALIIADAVTFVLAALLVLRVPGQPPRPAYTRSQRWQALRDRPYLAVTGLNTVLSLQYDVLVFALPLWIVGHTEAPRWLVSPLLVINTVLVVVLQVRVSRGIDAPPRAAQAMRRAGRVLAGASVLFGAAGSLPAGLAVAVLLLALVIHTFGELLHAAGSFGLSFDLAAPHAQGQYQGVFGLSLGASRALAPLLLTWTCLTLGLPGWLLLAVVFVLAAQAAPPLTRWAQQHRPATAEIAAA